jgi:hypothetical protein
MFFTHGGSQPIITIVSKHAAPTAKISNFPFFVIAISPAISAAYSYQPVFLYLPTKAKPSSPGSVLSAAIIAYAQYPTQDISTDNSLFIQ